MKKLEEKILELLNKYNDFPITKIKQYLPEVIGEYDFIFPMKEVENSNILLVSMVTKDFIIAFHNLFESKKISFKSCHLLVFGIECAEMYTKLPIVDPSSNIKKYKRLSWLPLLIEKVNFKEVQLPENLFKCGFLNPSDKLFNEKDQIIDTNSLGEIIDFIDSNFTKIKSINKRQLSYGIKHDVEKRIGKYVCNGDLIAAMIICGFEYEIAESNINCLFNISENSYKNAMLNS